MAKRLYIGNLNYQTTSDVHEFTAFRAFIAFLTSK